MEETYGGNDALVAASRESDSLLRKGQVSRGKARDVSGLVLAFCEGGDLGGVLFHMKPWRAGRLRKTVQVAHFVDLTK